MNLSRETLQSFVFNPVNATILDICASEIGKAERVLFTQLNHFTLGIISRLPNTEIWIITDNPRARDVINGLDVGGNIFTSSKPPPKLFNAIVSFGPILNQLEKKGKLILFTGKYLRCPNTGLRIIKRYSVGSIKSYLYLTISRLFKALGNPGLKHYFEDKWHQNLISSMPLVHLGRLSVVIYEKD